MLLLSDYIENFGIVGCNDYCRGLIKLFDIHRLSAIEYHDEPGYKFEQLNVNLVNVGEANKFAQLCHLHAVEYFNQLGLTKYIPQYGFEEVRIKKYMPDDDSRFESHVDVMNHSTAKRFLTFIMYLTDNQAGETEFPTLDIKISCRRGKMIAFPPTWQYPHRGLKPIIDPKYICMTTLHYL